MVCFGGISVDSQSNIVLGDKDCCVDWCAKWCDQIQSTQTQIQSIYWWTGKATVSADQNHPLVTWHLMESHDDQQSGYHGMNQRSVGCNDCLVGGHGYKSSYKSG